MKHPFQGEDAIFQSNISLLRRLMNAISPAPINSDLYFHEMHKLDKGSESKASSRGEGRYDGNTIICLWKRRLLNRDNLKSSDNRTLPSACARLEEHTSFHTGHADATTGPFPILFLCVKIIVN